MKVQVLGIGSLIVRDFQFRQVDLKRIYFVSAESFHRHDMAGHFCGSVDTHLDCSALRVGCYYDFVFDRAINPPVFIPALELLSFSSVDEQPEV